jgi:selenide,water dikinase
VAQVLRHLPPVTDPNLLVGTATHDDAGVYRLTDELALVQTVDFFPPVVDDPFVYGQIAAANALSDVYAMGGTPRTALNLVGYPDNELPMDWLGQILDGGNERLRAAGVVVVGGHTVRDAEIKFGYAISGLIHPGRIVTNAGAKPGDMLVLTKPLGTGFVTTANKKDNCPAELLTAACASMVQLNDVGRDAMLAAGAHAATDVTGFGLAGHAFEMASGASVTLRLDLDRLPAFAGVETLIERKFFTRASKSNREYVANSLRFAGAPDPVRVELLFDAQTSGGLLIAIPADAVGGLVDQLRLKGARAAAVVGEVLEREAAALVVA